MSLDDLEWFAAQSALPLVSETPEGTVVYNDAAAEVFDDAHPLSLEQAVEILLEGEPSLLHSAMEAIARARQGQAQRLHEGATRWLLSFLPQGRGRARLIATPRQWETPEVLEKRGMAAEMSAGVAHDVANALAAVGGWAEMAERSEDLATRLLALQRVQAGAQAAAELVRWLVELSAPTPAMERSYVDARQVIGDVVHLLELKAASRHVRLAFEAQQSAWVCARSTDLLMIVWNLVQNAIEAIQEGGQVKVQLGSEGAQLRVVISDDGPGMTDYQLRRAFEPFFTTKDSGTGLGLSQVQRAVQSLGGRIAVESRLGRGTRFTVLLPRAELPDELPAASPPPLSTAAPIPKALSTTGVRSKPRILGTRILVVEDDNALREYIRTALTLLGIEVTALARVEDVLRLPGPWDGALIDFALDDERGDVLLAHLRRQGKVQAAALMSGALLPEDLVPGGEPDTWLRKPFESGDLELAVRHLKALHDAEELQESAKKRS